jgi:RimJ/RimL family protein N-acetyltransferase
MEEEKLFDLDEHFTLYRTTTLTDEIVGFLENTAFGTRDNLYRHYYIREFIANTPRFEFFYARDKSGEVIGIVALCWRNFQGDPPFEGIYLRYFAASPKVRGQKIVGRLSRDVLDFLRKRQVTPVVFYVTIEGRNKASRAIADHLGYQFFAPIKLTGFSRFRPRMKAEVSRVTADEWRELLPRLDAQYADYAFWSHDGLMIDNDYFVLKKDGRIVCGAQSHPGHWVVEAMSGVVGKYILPVIPHIPFVRDIFNPNAFHFLNFEGIFVEKGHEADLVDLFESILHIKQYHSSLILMDERDPLFKFLQEQNRLGLLSRFTSDAKTSFILDFSCFDPDRAAQMEGKLCYAVGYDYI